MKNKIAENLGNMSQGDLASKVGVRREYINRIIHGHITPAVPLGIRIARALRKPVEEIFILEGEG